MFTPVQLDRYAEVLLWGLKTSRSRRFKKNDIILIRFQKEALPLAEVLYSKIIHSGMHPVVRMALTPHMESSFYHHANTNQLIFNAPGSKKLVQQINGSIYLHAPASLTHLKEADPKKIGRAAVARKFLKDILDKRDEAGHFGWTLAIYPTEVMARHAGLTLDEYRKQVIKACFLGRREPIDHWQAIYKKAQAIKRRLNRLEVDYYHITSKHIDLKVQPGSQRRWIGISGHNIPSFELFLSPDWRGTEGRYYADQPSYRSGNYIRGVRLEFKNGKVVQVRAEEGQAFVRQQLKMDDGADKLGEFSLTDKSFSKIDRFMANTLYDENFGGANGNCHVALGSSYSDTFSGDRSKLNAARKKKLGFNNSALHWDLVNTERKKVVARLASGKDVLIYQNGTFQI
jgi:aminopeptidase